MMINKIKNKLSVAIISAFVIMPTQVFAVGAMQDWPTHDSTVAGKIDALTTQLANSIKGDSVSAQLNERNATIQNLQMTQLSVLEKQRDVILEAAPTLEKCIAVTKSMGAGRVNAAVNQNTEVINRNMEQVRNASGRANFNAITQSPSKIGSCSEADVREGLYGCSKVGEYAGLDTSVKSLKFNSLTGSASIPPKQVAVAQQYIQNTVYGMAPTRLSGGRGANSELYNAQMKLWHSRVSAVEMALAFQLAYNTEINLGTTSSAAIMWNNEDMKAAYAATNGGIERPVNPSMKELLTTLVNRDLFYSNNKASEQSGDIATLLRALNEKMAINNYLQVQNRELLAFISDQQGAAVMGMYAPIDNNINQSAQAGN